MARPESEFVLQCKSVGLSPATVRQRMYKGMSLNEALSMPTKRRNSGVINYDRNRAQLIQADESWQAVRNCIKSLESQVKMFERIIGRIKEDAAGSKIYEQVMKEIVQNHEREV